MPTFTKMLKLETKAGGLFCILVLAAYIIVYSYNLGAFPIHFGDETAYIEPSFNLIKYGQLTNPYLPKGYGIDMFASHITLVSLLVYSFGAYFLGLELGYLRFIPLFFGFFSVLLAYVIAKKVFNKQVAVLAFILLSLNPLFFQNARLLRPEIILTAFGLLSIFCCYSGLPQKKYLFFLGGLSAAACPLIHPTAGLFFYLSIATVFMFLRYSDARFKNFGAYFTLGSVLVFIPYLAFLLTDPEPLLRIINWQQGLHIPKCLGGIFYSFLIEYKRWVFGKTAPLSTIPGLFSLFYCFYLICRNKIHQKQVYVLVLLPSLFILFLAFFQPTKYWGYLTIILPYFSILLAYAFFSFTKVSSFKRFISIAGIALLLSGFVYTNIYHLKQTAKADFGAYCKEITGAIPAKSRVFGSLLSWFCFEDKTNFFAIDGHDFWRLGGNYNKSDFWKIEYLVLDPETKEMLAKAPLNKTELIKNFKLIKVFKNDYYGLSIFDKSDKQTEIYKRKATFGGDA